MPTPYVVVGALARIESADPGKVRRQLAAITGVSTFELGVPQKLGVLIEADGIDAARSVLDHSIRGIEGVLGVWPISLESDVVGGTPSGSA